MRLWVKVALGLALTLILLVGFGWFSLTKPEREISKNPIMREIQKVSQPWKTRVPLIGSVFESGQSKAEVDSFLLGNNFAIDDSFRFYFADDSAELNDIIWSASQGSMVCNMEWSVITQFDENDNLISANGVVSARGCL
jgi:hypothetical protein